jgi:hypothetical protein
VVEPCSDHGKLRDFFHPETKLLGCHECIVCNNLNIDDCRDARETCKVIMDRFFTLLDNVTYMKHEHIQKEKEYGIPWRSAFKVELYEISASLHARTMSESEAEEMDEDPFVVMHKIVRQDSVDAATFDSRCQADLLFMLVNQLEFLEIGVYTIKKMLKESDHSLFNDIKTLVRGALKTTHLEFNPQSDNYKEDDLNEKA